jgi:hypothetical protein
MMLFHLAGHSGAGKSRLTAALGKQGVKFPRAILYTSRSAREGEIHGRDYYFLSKSAIDALPKESFFVGPVREMLQAVDLVQIQEDLEDTKNNLVLIEIFADLWPQLLPQIASRVRGRLRSTSVFMTAVDPEIVKALSDNKIRGRHIQTEVERILSWRGKDAPDKIVSRSKSAVNEVLSALKLQETKARYDEVLHSAPEGPDGQDEWTKGATPVGRAQTVLDRITSLISAAASE